MPVARFVRSHGVRVGAIIIATILLFKVGEAFLGRMSLVFYKEIGFSKADIALYQKGLGTISVCFFSVVGSVVNARYGLFRGILLSGIAMASTNLLFALLAWHPVRWLFTCAVVTDQFTTAISTVAFVAFISQLCDRTYTATQYAAFASIGNLSRTTLSAGSGVVVDALGGNWTLFFVLTTLMVVPSLILLLVVRKDLEPLMEGRTTKFI
jgi:PAT family beta-lactamase induction signal transducer AmpG